MNTDDKLKEATEQLLQSASSLMNSALALSRAVNRPPEKAMLDYWKTTLPAPKNTGAQGELSGPPVTAPPANTFQHFGSCETQWGGACTCGNRVGNVMTPKLGAVTIEEAEGAKYAWNRCVNSGVITETEVMRKVLTDFAKSRGLL